MNCSNNRFIYGAKLHFVWNQITQLSGVSLCLTEVIKSKLVELIIETVPIFIGRFILKELQRIVCSSEKHILIIIYL